MSKLIISLILVVLVSQAQAFYESYETDKVVKLTSQDFSKMVVESNNVWMVEFYAPWCGHCKTLKPEFVKAAKALEGIAKLGAVDMTTDKSAGEPYGISGFPTLKLFGKKGEKPVDYSGARTASGIVDFVLRQSSKIAKERLNGGKSSGSGGTKRERDVVTLTKRNFDKEVLNGDDTWLIEMYAPWCGHCKQLLPQFKRAARKLKGLAKMGKVDCTIEKQLCQRYGVNGYPTIKSYIPNASKKLQDYKGSRDARGIEQAVLNLIGKRGGANRGSNKGSNGGSQGGNGGSQEAEIEKGVYVLTERNFDKNVYSDDVWLVEFYAPWCGHCKKLLPEFEQAAQNLKKHKNLHYGKVDCTVETAISNKFDVSGYPTIKYFRSGKSSGEDYRGGRSAADLEEFMLNKVGKARVVLEVKQMVSTEDFNTYCIEFEGICFVTLLSHIYDSTAAQRQQQISMLQKIQKKYSKTPISFLWSQGGDQFDFEQTFGLNFGYPAMMAMSHSKNKMAVMKKSFGEKNVERFVIGLMTGKERLKNIQKLPQNIKNVQPWDGKDKQPEVYENFDDEDIELDSELNDNTDTQFEETDTQFKEEL